MKIIILLLAVSLSVALAFLVAFIWGAKTGQFEDNFADANRILFDNKTTKKENN